MGKRERSRIWDANVCIAVRTHNTNHDDRFGCNHHHPVWSKILSATHLDWGLSLWIALYELDDDVSQYLEPDTVALVASDISRCECFSGGDIHVAAQSTEQLKLAR